MWERIKRSASRVWKKVSFPFRWLGNKIVSGCRWLGIKLGFSAAPPLLAAIPERICPAAVPSFSVVTPSSHNTSSVSSLTVTQSIPDSYPGNNEQKFTHATPDESKTARIQERSATPALETASAEIVGFRGPVDIEKMILGYYGNLIDDSKTEYTYQSGLSLFGNITNLVLTQTEHAARHVLAGNPTAALVLVAQNSSILHCPIDISDDRGRKFKEKTLLQIAAMAGNFNLRDRTADEKEDHGLVERLSLYLSEEERIRQLGAVFPPGWEKEMEKRTQLILDELKQFSEDIIKLTDAEIREIQRRKNANEQVPVIERFRNALLAHSRTVIETGYIFDPQIFVAAIQFFEANVGRFGGWYTDKSDLFWVHGFGLLQDLAAACDLQVIKSGIYYAVYEKKAVDRTFNFFTGRPAILSGLGSSFYLDILGWDRSRSPPQARAATHYRATFSILISGKKISAAKLMQQEQPRVHTNFQCSIM